MAVEESPFSRYDTREHISNRFTYPNGARDVCECPGYKETGHMPGLPNRTYGLY